MPFDLLVLDLDGTLLGPDGSVSRANADAVARARAAGIEVVIATGRAHIESRHVLSAIDHDGVVVAAGGSMTCHGPTGQTMSRSAMPHALVEEVTETLVAHAHKALLLKDAHATGYDYLAVGPAELDPASHWWFETMPVRVRFVESLADDPDPHETVRAGVVASESELRPLADLLRTALGSRGFLQHWAAVTEDGVTGPATHLLEVFNPEVNKSTAIAALCAARGTSMERVVAIGDGLNDVELVRDAGLGIAMGNADARVHAVADRTTETSARDGVAVAIDALLAGA